MGATKTRGGMKISETIAPAVYIPSLARSLLYGVLIFCSTQADFVTHTSNALARVIPDIMNS